MRIGLLGTIGYSLSLIIILITLLGQMPIFPFVLLAYPVSIVIRGIFWFRLGSQTSNMYFKIISVLLLILGFTISTLTLYNRLGYYLETHSLILAVLSRIDEDVLKIIISLWTIYTFAEAIGYISYARFLGIWTIYSGALNLPSAIILAYQFLLIEKSLVLFTEPLSYPIILALSMLLCSALGISYGSYITRIDIALKKPEKKEVDELDKLLERESSTREESDIKQKSRTHYTNSSMVTNPVKAISLQSLPQQYAKTPMIIVEAISRSSEAYCAKCGSTVPVGTKDCPSCGSKLYESRPGLRCPVCGAPLSYSNRITSEHRVCGICFSDLRLRQIGA